MEANNSSQQSVYPVVLQATRAAIALCEKLESDFRNTGDFCHNNIGSKTYEDWENMDKFLLNAADEMRKMRKCVELLATVSSRQKPRNCDVGTVEEQYQRYAKFCCSHYRIANNDSGNCSKCPFAQPVCKLQWAQMPYKESEAGE